jgi:cytoskeletal protein RodZ
VTKYFIGMVGALVGALVGGWLMLAPFALGYQPSGAAWADPTITDFWSGLGILVISVVGLVMYAVGLVGELRQRDIIEQRSEAPQEDQQAAQQVQAAGMPVGGGTQAGSGDMEQILLPLVTAMLKDMQDQRRREENGESPQQSAAPSQRFDQERRTQQ